MSTVGWIGAMLLAFCGVPELIRTLQTKQCNLSWGFMIMWGLGEIFTLVPVISQGLGAFLVFNYSVNLAIIVILFYYKLRKTVLP